MAPQFSIIIPCYNLDNVIGRTIDSVRKQSYKNFELLLIDDGSEDKTLDILKAYEKEDARIKVISKPNGGVSSARNLGIKHSEGRYLYFFDGDDLIKPELLQKANDVLAGNNIDVFSFGYNRSTNSGEITKRYSHKKYGGMTFDNSMFLSLYLHKKISQNICSLITRREIITDNKIYFDTNTSYTEDIEFIVKVLSKGGNIYYDSHEYFTYVFRAGSAVNRKIYRDNFDVQDRIRNYLNGIDDEGGDYFLCIWFVNFYRNIFKKGSNKETVRKYLEYEWVLENFRFTNNKYSYVIQLFIILYKPFLKKCLVRKFKL